MKGCNSCCGNCRYLDRDMRFKGENAYIMLYKYACAYTGEICQYISSDDELKSICCERWKATEADMIINRQLVKEFETELDQRLRRWESVKKFGSDAPCWTDGISANIIRKQIADIRNRVEQLLDKADYPKAYFRGVPEQLDENYMARADHVRNMAVQVLQQYDACEDLQWISDNIAAIPSDVKPAIKKRALNVQNYRRKLADAIEQDDFVTMKIHLSGNNFMAAFGSCRQEIEKSLPKGNRRKEKAVPKENGESKRKAGQISGQMKLSDYLAA